MEKKIPKSKKKWVIISGVAILILSIIVIGTEDADTVSDISVLGFLAGIIIIIVGCCLKSQKKIDKENEVLANVEFDITQNIDNYLYLDENRKKICLPMGLVKKKIDPERIFNYGDILNYELLEDGNSVSKGGVGRAIVGGALFGDVGAIVGGSTGHKQKQTCTKLQIKITTNNIEHPAEYINFIIAEIRKDNMIYKNAYSSAQKVLSALDIICNPKSSASKEKKNDASSNKSAAEQIKEFKELLDSGAITEEEFEAKKKQLLDL